MVVVIKVMSGLIKLPSNMSKINPKIEKLSEDRGTGQFCRRQSKSSKVVGKKENTAGRCKYIKNDLFDMVRQ